MQRDARAYLTDARDAAGLIRQFVQGRTLEDYRTTAPCVGRSRWAWTWSTMKTAMN